MFNDFTGIIIGNGHFHALGTAQQTEIYVVNTVGLIRISAYCSVFEAGSDCRLVGRQAVNVKTERQQISVFAVRLAVRTRIEIVRSHRRSVVSSSFQPFVFRQAGIVFAFFNGIEVIVEHRSVQPVAEERQIRNGEIVRIALYRVQTRKTFYVSTVGKNQIAFGIRLIEISFSFRRQSDGNRNFCNRVCGNGDFTVRIGTVFYRYGNLAVVKDIGFFFNRPFFVVLNPGNAFAEYVYRNVVRQGSRSPVYEVEIQFVNARFVGVVVKTELRKLTPVYRQISFGIKSGVEVCETGTLFTRTYGLTFFVVSNGRGRHQNLIAQTGNVLFFTFTFGDILIGEFLFEVLSEQRRNAGKVGSSHTRAGVNRVLVTCYRRQNVTAVTRDIGIEGKIGQAAPGREVRHKRTGKAVSVQRNRAGGMSCHSVTRLLVD